MPRAARTTANPSRPVDTALGASAVGACMYIVFRLVSPSVASPEPEPPPPLPTAQLCRRAVARRAVAPWAPKWAREYENASRHRRYRPAGRHRLRRVFDLLPFGSEIQMLRLHISVLESVVDTFLVSEAPIWVGTLERKPLYLTQALPSFAPSLQQRVLVRVVDLVAATGDPNACGSVSMGSRRRGGVRPGRKLAACLERWQRLETLRMLVQVGVLAQQSSPGERKHRVAGRTAWCLPSRQGIRTTTPNWSPHGHVRWLSRAPLRERSTPHLEMWRS